MSEKIKKWYNQGLWTEIMVMNALRKGAITQAQCDEILAQTEG